jgi:hypothetical protein
VNLLFRKHARFALAAKRYLENPAQYAARALAEAAA